MDQTKNSSVTLEEELLLNGTKGYIKEFELRLREYSNSKVSQSLFRQWSHVTRHMTFQKTIWMDDTALRLYHYISKEPTVIQCMSIQEKNVLL